MINLEVIKSDDRQIQFICFNKINTLDNNANDMFLSKSC
jgi:hypothetical protein